MSKDFRGATLLIQESSASLEVKANVIFWSSFTAVESGGQCIMNLTEYTF